MIFFASIHNWCTIELANYSAGNQKIIIISGDRSFGNLKLWPVLYMFRFFVNILNINKQSHAYSFLVKCEYFLFDIFVAILILIFRPTRCYLWSGMSLLSLKISKLLLIDTILWIGEEYVPRRRLNIPGLLVPDEYWKNKFSHEVELTKHIFVESTFVKNSIPENFHKKVSIVLTPILFNNLSQHVSVEKSTFDLQHLKIAVVNSDARKNFNFALDVCNRLSNDYKIDLHIYSSQKTSNFVAINKNLNLLYHPMLSRSEFHSSLISNSIDIFLLPSLSDGGPRTLIEILSLGIVSFTSEYCIGPDIKDIFSNIVVLPLNVNIWANSISHYKFNIQFDLINEINNYISIIKNQY